MSIPSPLGPGLGAAYNGPPTDAGVVAAQGAKAASPLPEPELRGLQAEIASAMPPDTLDELTEPGGAPRLAEPTLSFADGDELAMLLTSLDSRIRETQARTAAQGLDLAGLQGRNASTGLAERLAEASGKQADAAAKAKAGAVWDWVSRVSGFAGALAAQAAQLPPPQDGETLTQPLLAAAVMGALSAGTETVPPATANIDDLLDPGLRQASGLSTPDGQALNLGFSLLAADQAGAQAELQALAEGATPEQAARVRLAVSVAAAVNTLVTVLATVTAALGAPALGDPASPPSDAPAPDQIDAALQTQRERAARLAGATDEIAATARTAARTAAQDAQAVREQAQSAAQQVQATVRELVHRQMQLQLQSGQLQNAGEEGVGITGLAVSQKAQKEEALRLDARHLQQHLSELQTQQAEQQDKLREMLLSLQQLTLDLSQLMAASADPRVQSRHVVRG